jgi:Flp pilus assembly protein TadG
MSARLLHALRNCLIDRRGVSAIEFAIIAPVMLTLMLHVYDLGNAAQQQITLQEAVRAGGQYALHYPPTSTTAVTAVQTAVTGALPAGWSLSNAASITCSCSAISYSCTSLPSPCTSPFVVAITATKSYTALEPTVAAAIPNLTATYVTRIR